MFSQRVLHSFIMALPFMLTVGNGMPQQGALAEVLGSLGSIDRP